MHSLCSYFMRGLPPAGNGPCGQIERAFPMYSTQSDQGVAAGMARSLGRAVGSTAVALLLAVLMVLAPGGASAGGADVRGLIIGIDAGAGTFNLNGTTIRTNGATVFENELGANVTFAFFQYGMQIRARGAPQGDGSILADRINEREPGSGSLGGGTQRFLGVLESIDTGSGLLKVNGITVETTAYTAYESLAGLPITMAGLTVGDIVKVGGTPIPSGNILAGEIEIEDDLGGQNLAFDVKFEGTVSAVNAGAGTMTVAGNVVFTNAMTRYEDADGEPLTFADFPVGTYVGVKANTQADGSLLAVQIELKTATPGIDHNTELRGIIEAMNIGTGTFTVNAVSVATNGSTVFLNEQNATITAADFAVGNLVEIEGMLQGDGSIVATKFKKEGNNFDDNPQGDTRLFGPIDTIDTGAGTLTMVGQTVTTNGSTVVLNNAGVAITFAQLAAGQTVETEGFLQADGSILARRIKREDGAFRTGGTNVIIQGAVASRDTGAGTLVIRGKTIQTNGSTVLTNKFGAPITLGSLLIGDYISVAGDGQAGGGVLAARGSLEDQFFSFGAPPPTSAVVGWESYE